MKVSTKGRYALLWDVIIEYTDRFTLADLMKNEDIENPICKEG